MAKRLPPWGAGSLPQANAQSVAVFEALKTAIATGVYPPGHPLPKTRDLMARFGVGRASVVDALAALSALGLVVSNGAGRARAALPALDFMVGSVLSQYAPQVAASPIAAAELGRARYVFLRDLVREAALRADPQVGAELKAAHERRVGLAEDPAECARAAREVWSRLAQANGSRLHRLILDHILESADAPWLDLEAERQLVGLVRDGDARSAENLLQAALNARV